MKIRLNYDFIGIFNSLICLIHCLWLPLLFSTFSSLVDGFIHTLWIDILFITIAFIIGIKTIYKQYKKHNHFLPPLLFCIGFIMLLIHSFLPVENILFILIAFSFIVISHYLNWKNTNKKNKKQQSLLIKY